MKGSRTLLFRLPLAFRKIPVSSGVYLFLDKRKKVLYVGKAVNLRNRLQGHFRNGTLGKTQSLIRESAYVRVHTTQSDIAALLLESRLIKKHQPRFNVALKSDRDYFYVCFVRRDAHDVFPYIIVTHQPKTFARARCIGPFVDGALLKRTMHLIRTYFPYCTCKKRHARMCLNSHIGLCQGLCCQRDARAADEYRVAYRRIISAVEHIIQGKDKQLARSLEISVRAAAKREAFEQAGQIKKQWDGLKRIMAHQSGFQNEAMREYERAVLDVRDLLGSARMYRIEMFDTSMLQGTNRVGAMTVFENGAWDRSQWRLFRIRSAEARDDTAMMREVVTRRFGHPEWPHPDVVMVDGGAAQRRAVAETLRDLHIRIPVAAIRKNDRHAPDAILYGAGARIRTKTFAALLDETARFLSMLSEQTHRFVIHYYRRKARGIQPG